MKIIYLYILTILVFVSCTSKNNKPDYISKHFDRFINTFDLIDLPAKITPQELGKYIILGDYNSDIDSLDIVNILFQRDSVKRYDPYNVVFKKGLRFKLKDNILLLIPKINYGRNNGKETIEILFYIFNQKGEMISLKSLGLISEVNQVSYLLSIDEISLKQMNSIIMNDTIIKTDSTNLTYLIKNDKSLELKK